MPCLLVVAEPIKRREQFDTWQTPIDIASREQRDRDRVRRAFRDEVLHHLPRQQHVELLAPFAPGRRIVADRLAVAEPEVRLSDDEGGGAPDARRFGDRELLVPGRS